MVLTSILLSPQKGTKMAHYPGGNRFESFNIPIKQCNENPQKHIKRLSHETEMGCWWNGLMKHHLVGDEPLIVRKLSCFLVFTFEFYFLQSYCTKVALLYVIGATLWKMCQRLLATL